MKQKAVVPYYTLEATLRSGDKIWPKWPHVHLANLKALEDFKTSTTDYGKELFANRVFTWPMPPRASGAAPVPGLWVSPTKGEAREVCRYMARDELRQARDLLRRGWQGDTFALEVLAGKSHDPSLLPAVNAALKTSVTVDEERGVEIFAEDLWSFARIAFLRDYALGRTHLCKNPKCIRVPFFLHNKLGQQYCDHKCAVSASVREFRKREKKERETRKKDDKQARNPTPARQHRTSGRRRPRLPAGPKSHLRQNRAAVRTGNRRHG